MENTWLKTYNKQSIETKVTFHNKYGSHSFVNLAVIDIRMRGLLPAERNFDPTA
jgi:hypothetical protein